MNPQSDDYTIKIDSCQKKMLPSAQKNLLQVGQRYYIGHYNIYPQDFFYYNYIYDKSQKARLRSGKKIPFLHDSVPPHHAGGSLHGGAHPPADGPDC